MLEKNKEYDPDKNTPLHHACRANDVELAKLLLEGRANVNAVNRYQNSPLMVACEYYEEGFPLVKLLVESEANVNVANCFDETPLLTAYTSSSYNEIFTYLLDRTDEQHINKVEERSNSTLLELVGEREDEDALEAIKLRLKTLKTKCADDDSSKKSQPENIFSPRPIRKSK